MSTQREFEEWAEAHFSEPDLRGNSLCGNFIYLNDDIELTWNGWCANNSALPVDIDVPHYKAEIVKLTEQLNVATKLADSRHLENMMLMSDNEKLTMGIFPEHRTRQFFQVIKGTHEITLKASKGEG